MIIIDISLSLSLSVRPAYRRKCVFNTSLLYFLVLLKDVSLSIMFIQQIILFVQSYIMNN